MRQLIELQPDNAYAYNALGYTLADQTDRYEEAVQLIAKALEDAGVFSMILEAVPAPLGQLVAEAVKVPVIGIGAGPDVDGQVLVTYDMIGLFEKFVPKFVKQYSQIRKTILEALKEYKEDVVAVTFPGPEHSFKMPDEALEQLKKLVKT